MKIRLEIQNGFELDDWKNLLDFVSNKISYKDLSSGNSNFEKF